MTITELSIKRPILIIVLFTVLGFLGIFSYGQLSYELLPKITSPFVTVITLYPGASPSEVENAVTKRIEESVSGVGKLKRVFSTSSENVSTVFVEFVQSANADLATQDVQRKINELGDLPLGVKRPMVLKFQLDEIPVIRMAVTSSLADREFAQILKDQIKPRLAQIKGVSQISLIGLSEREINISIDADKLRAYNCSILQVTEALRRSNMDVPAGKINDKDAQFGVRLRGKFENIDDLRNLIIISLPAQNGASPAMVKLSDVANVSDGAKDTETLSRLQGKDACGVLVQKQSDANTVEVSRLVREEITKLQSEFSQSGITFTVAQDASEFTLDAADAVVHDLKIAVLLVALVMMIFLHSWRNSLIVMISIPASLVSTFIAMYMFNFSLNLMTLLAMSLVVGILVDDSIVVLESIYQQLERGMEARQAALKGRMDIGFSALAITLVDVVVFLPLSLVQGLIGDIMRQFALVVVISTLLSLLVSFTLTPMLASRFSRLEHLTKDTLMGRFGLWFEAVFERISRLYEDILTWTLHHRIIVAISAFVLLVGAFMLPATGFVGSEFVTASDRGELSVSLTLPPGTPLAETNRIVREIEGKFSAMPEVQKLFTSLGTTSSGFDAESVSNGAYIDVTLTPKEMRQRTDQEASRVALKMKQIAQETPGLKARVAPIGMFGQADDAPIQVLVFGANRDSVFAAGGKVAEILQTIKGSADVRLSIEDTKPETRIEINREKMAQFGLSLEEVGFATRTALAGNDDGKIRLSGTEYPVRIRYDAADRAKTEHLKHLTFTNMSGQRVELQQFATVEQSQSPSKLDRRNRNASITVLSKAIGVPSGTMGEELKQKIANTRLPIGIRVDYLGDLENQGDAFGSLGIALLAAILFVYLLMVALYNSWMYPFIVLFSIPVAMVGALLALALTMKSLNIFSILGIIMMVGLVAKNAILLVDRTNAARSEGMTVPEAIMDAGRTRLRPRLMTTIAMVIGMLPIALSNGAGGEWKSGLAVALIGGLTSSMFLTLILVPSVYVDVERLRAFTLRILDKARNRAVSNERQFKQKQKNIHHSNDSVVIENVDTHTVQENNMTNEHFKDVSTGVKSLSILALIFFSSSFLFAQPTSNTVKKLSLVDAVKIAMENNPELQIARLEEIKAEQRVREVRSAFLPQVSASLQYIRNIQVPVFFFPAFGFDATTGELVAKQGELQAIRAGLANSYNLTGSVQLPLIQEDLRHTIHMTEIGKSIATESIAGNRVQKARDVKKAYFDVLMVEEQARLLQQNIIRAEETLAQVRSLLSKGMATETDTLRAFVAVENTRPLLTKVINSGILARASLAIILGLDGAQTLELSDSLLFPKISSSLLDYSTLLQSSLDSRSDIKQLTLQRDLSDVEKISHQASYLPSLSAFGQYQIVSQADDFNFSKQVFPQSSFVGVQISVPIFNGFRTDSRVQQSIISSQQAERRLDYVKNLVGTEVRLAQTSLQEARQRFQVQERTIQAAERNYRLVRSRYAQGLVKQIDVSDADLALTQAKTNLAQAIYDYLLAEADVAKSLGKE
jgi:hydrophobe/amphiphile efflux-1 (HAE1) family protein